MNPHPSVFSNRERKSPHRGLGRSLEQWEINVTSLRRHQSQLSAMCCIALN